MARALRRGSLLGKYRLVSRLGRGGFAEVWKARDSVMDIDVALKIAHEDVAKEWGRAVLEHEAKIASRLQHPGIVSVRNADWIDGRFAIATDLAIGNLDEYPRARRRAPEALDIIRQIAAGLAYAHGKRVMHRDVKPQNILIFADGRAAVCDFGSSRIDATRSYTEAGTLGYMAPEQAYGRVRFASDVFSLGVIAYEVLTGVLPSWPFEWPPERHDRFVAKVPEPLQPVLRRAAEFDPRKRYSDAGEFHAAVERAFKKLEAPAPKSRPRRRRKSAPPRSPLQVQAEAFRRAHGRELSLRFDCHRCGGPISEAMGSCPWCGSKDNSFREVSRYPLVCPSCERGVRPEWTSCPWCFAGRFEGNGRKPPPDPHAERTCAARKCEGELQPFMRYCPRCKRKPGRLWSHPSLPDRCPKCRWPTNRSYLPHCPWCGRREPRAGTFRGSRG